jgi:hypothetical protein
MNFLKKLQYSLHLKGSNPHCPGESLKCPLFQVVCVSPTFMQHTILPQFSRTHKISAFLSFVQNLDSAMGAQLPKDIACLSIM